ncbi:hypothetical protein D918_01451 [Trichuris suis]|nr:hypothetical protein D918_01451 [Trichuris suis]
MCSLSSLLCECKWLDDSKLRSKKIDHQLKKEKRKLRREVTVLLLGSGESGKSTFLKQMVIIHGRGEFTFDEAMEYKAVIYSNILNGMRTLIAAKLVYNDSPWEFPERTPMLIQKFTA